MSDYLKYRGKCKEFCDKLIAKHPHLTLVRGYYFCPIWNVEEQHWWCEDINGTIIDPTKLQFGSKGLGIYRKFDGTVECSNCGKIVAEEDAQHSGRYSFCSSRCYGHFVGV